jgi:hypothetical protein
MSLPNLKRRHPVARLRADAACEEHLQLGCTHEIDRLGNPASCLALDLLAADFTRRLSTRVKAHRIEGRFDLTDTFSSVMLTGASTALAIRNEPTGTPGDGDPEYRHENEPQARQAGRRCRRHRLGQ